MSERLTPEQRAFIAHMISDAGDTLHPLEKVALTAMRDRLDALEAENERLLQALDAEKHSHWQTKTILEVAKQVNSDSDRRLKRERDRFALGCVRLWDMRAPGAEVTQDDAAAVALARLLAQGTNHDRS